MPIVPDVTLSAADVDAFRTQHLAVSVPDAVFRVEGAGMLDCVQGIFTNDVKKPGPGMAVWGAILAPKGMIITDTWVLRDSDVIWLVVPRAAHQTARDLFARTIPPRLARIVDRSEDSVVQWLLGGAPTTTQPRLFRPMSLAPFSAVMLTPRQADVGPSPGWPAGQPALADLAKLRLGWPTLGREIDEKTLPQEVRFDELDGVRYDKGCYTGQETVARLHFRGHANRLLRGVCWAPGDTPTDRDVTVGTKPVGSLRTVARLGDRTVALAVLRREVGVGDAVRAGATEGVVVDLPIDLTDVTAA